jgi:hypothetical protein
MIIALGFIIGKTREIMARELKHIILRRASLQGRPWTDAHCGCHAERLKPNHVPDIDTQTSSTKPA